MYTFLDFENKVFIPQNKNTFFTINKSNNYNYAVEIKINLKEDISILNLFLLLKSYINDNVFLTTSIGCIFKEKDGKRFITDNLSLRYFNKMNQFDFEE
jgi:protein associated with RNAse G/E